VEILHAQPVLAQHCGQELLGAGPLRAQRRAQTPALRIT
jgi:hypothetical protein